MVNYLEKTALRGAGNYLHKHETPFNYNVMAYKKDTIFQNRPEHGDSEDPNLSFEQSNHNTFSLAGDEENKLQPDIKIADKGIMKNSFSDKNDKQVLQEATPSQMYDAASDHDLQISEPGLSKGGRTNKHIATYKIPTFEAGSGKGRDTTKNFIEKIFKSEPLLKQIPSKDKEHPEHDLSRSNQNAFNEFETSFQREIKDSKKENEKVIKEEKKKVIRSSPAVKSNGKNEIVEPEIIHHNSNTAISKQPIKHIDNRDDKKFIVEKALSNSNGFTSMRGGKSKRNRPKNQKTTSNTKPELLEIEKRSEDQFMLRDNIIGDEHLRSPKKGKIIPTGERKNTTIGTGVPRPIIEAAPFQKFNSIPHKSKREVKVSVGRLEVIIEGKQNQNVPRVKQPVDDGFGKYWLQRNYLRFV